MPSVKPGEKEEDYVSRCIAQLVGEEGLTQEQAAGKCYGMFREHSKTLQGMGTADVPIPADHPPCECPDKANCTCKTKRKTMPMTPEEMQALQQQQQQGGSAPPPPEPQKSVPTTVDDGGADPADDSNEPPSVQVSKAVYTSLKNLMGNLKAAENTYENPEAKEYFNGAFTEKCNEAMGEIKGLISKLGSAVSDDESENNTEAATEEEEAMKSFLALGQTQDLKLLGIAAPLKAIAKSKNITDEQRLTLNGVLKSITGLCDNAKKNSEAAKQKALAAEVASLQENYTGLAKSINALQTSLTDLLPK